MDFKLAICILGMSLSYHLVFSAHTHESVEMDTMHFYYDRDMHYFIAATHGTCFMAPLTHDESDHVHSNTGIEDLELKMMREWIGVLPETKIYHDDGHLPSNIQKWCSNRDIVLLERTLNETSSTSASLLG